MSRAIFLGGMAGLVTILAMALGSVEVSAMQGPTGSNAGAGGNVGAGARAAAGTNAAAANGTAAANAKARNRSNDHRSPNNSDRYPNGYSMYRGEPGNYWPRPGAPYGLYRNWENWRAYGNGTFPGTSYNNYGAGYFAGPWNLNGYNGPDFAPSSQGIFGNQGGSPRPDASQMTFNYGWW
jgi:hypothetical protein